MSEKDCGSAFPYHHTFVDERGQLIDSHCKGLSVRDWFARMALLGMVGQYFEWTDRSPEKVAKACYEFADAMDKERNA